jgi:hypothetical protein
MSTVQEIESAIQGLSAKELEELYAWMDEHQPQPIDARLKADLDAGRMDARIGKSLAEHQAGRTRAL